VEPSGEVEELCTRLDNLPLAVELAAARVRVLSPAQILERVSQRLDLLKGGRDADTRQRTLRATIEWSYELLSEAEQQFFRRLSVFAGGCTLHAAEEVAEAELDTLQSLVDKSLLRHAEERCWMLETIREYAAERLSESGEAEEMGQRHAAWILGLAAKGDEPLEPEAQDRWLNRLAIELSNLRVALSWAASHEPSALVRGVAPAFEFWMTQGLLDEAGRWLDGVNDADALPLELRAGALRVLSAVAQRHRDPEQLRELSERRLAASRELGDLDGVASSLNTLGTAARFAGDDLRATALFHEALEAAEASGNEVLLAVVRGRPARAHLGDELFDALRMQGHAMAEAEALELALLDVD
jgi:hypothetical protein